MTALWPARRATRVAYAKALAQRNSLLGRVRSGNAGPAATSPISPRSSITLTLPIPISSSGRRHETTVPQQALYLMNSPLVIEQARHVVARPDVQSCATDEARVHRLYAILYQRVPRPEEVQVALQFVREAGTPEDAAPLAAAATAAQAPTGGGCASRCRIGARP